MYVYGKKIGGWFISFWLIFFSSLSLWGFERRKKKSRLGKR